MLVSELRPYQVRAVEDIRNSVRNGVRKLVVQAATGAGKTKIAAAIVDSALSKGNSVAFVVPAVSLIDQTVESFYNEGIRDVGVIQANHMMTDWSKPVQVCSIQTIQCRKAFPKSAVVIFDECHRLHEAHKKWLTDPEWQNVPMIGLSATPWTRGLGKYFNSLLVAATTKDLIDQGFLSKFRTFATGHPDLKDVKVTAGDYNEGQLSGAMQKGSLTADIISTWMKLWGKDKTLCFAVDRTHAKSIQERFELAGITCGYQDADTPPQERREIKRKFHDGVYQVVVNIQTLTTGVDWDVRCLILARPTRSEMLYVQIIGRALRTAPGKEHALILDHSDTTSRLGFVTDIYHDQLNTGQPVVPTERKNLLPKKCSKCAFLKPPRTSVCPNCSHEAKAPANDIYEDDGELTEFVPGKIIAGKLQRVNNREKIWTEEERKIFFKELMGYAETYGYKEGWAAVNYKDKFGQWPPRLWSRLVAAKVPSPGTILWIKRKNIAWANRRNSAVQA